MFDVLVEVVLAYWVLGQIFALACGVFLSNGGTFWHEIEHGDRYRDLPDYWQLRWAGNAKRTFAWPYYLYVLAFRIKLGDEDV